jgi:acyl dehydratase
MGPITSENTTIDLGTRQVSRELVQDYLKAVGDSLAVYFEQNLVPPLALSAYALWALLEKMSLPSGAIHSLQEIEQLVPVALDSQITGVATLEKPRRRGNLEFITATLTLTDDQGRIVQTGKTTVLVTGPKETS